MKAEDYRDLFVLEDTFWWFVGMREIVASLLDPFCPPGLNRVVLDAGCGAGGNLKWLERYAGQGRVIGMDIAVEALGFCQRRHPRNLVRASATDLAFGNATFDLVTSFDVLVQLPGEGSDDRAMLEMLRVLKPGGIAFIRVAAHQWMRSSHDEALGTQRRYQLHNFTEKMTLAGFQVLRTTYANTMLFPLAIIERHLLKHVGVTAKGSDVKPLPPRLKWLNALFTRMLKSEATYLQQPHTTFPTGLSVICVAQKPK